MLAQGSGAQANAAFGQSVALAGDVLVVGAPGAQGSAGAYQLELDATGSPRATAWLNLANHLPAGVSVAGSQFGWDVAGYRAWTGPREIVVGAPGYASGGQQFGGAVAFHIAGDSFVVTSSQLILAPVNAVTSSDASYVSPVPVNARLVGDRFGEAVNVARDLIAVGAPQHDPDRDGLNPLGNAGAVFLYNEADDDASSAYGWAWTGTLTAGDHRHAQDRFGAAVSIGDIWGAFPRTVVVGAPGQHTDRLGQNPSEGAGAVFVFDLNRATQLDFAYKIDSQQVLGHRNVGTPTSESVGWWMWGTVLE